MPTQRVYMAERWFAADHVPPPIDGPYTIPFRFAVLAPSRKSAEKKANDSAQKCWDLVNDGRIIAGKWAHDAVVLYCMGKAEDVLEKGSY